MRDTSTLSTPVARFANSLLTSDLPGLADERRLETVAFIERRVSVLPSFTRFGVIVIGMVVGGLCRVIGTAPVIGFVTSKPIPLLSEYPRLVRSLGYTFIWETWPATQTDGSAPER